MGNYKITERHSETYDVEIDPTIDSGDRIIDELEERGFDTEWLYSDGRESFRRASIQEYGMENFVENHSDGGENGEIRMSAQHAALWLCEILGQISDGAWENYWGSPESPETDYNAWEWFYNLDVVIDDGIDGVVLSEVPPDRNMDVAGRLTNFDAQVGRMAFILTAFDEQVTEEDVHNLLQDFDEALEQA